MCRFFFHDFFLSNEKSTTKARSMEWPASTAEDKIVWVYNSNRGSYNYESLAPLLPGTPPPLSWTFEPNSFQIFKSYAKFRIHDSCSSRDGNSLKRFQMAQEIWIYMTVKRPDLTKLKTMWIKVDFWSIYVSLGTPKIHPWIEFG